MGGSQGARSINLGRARGLRRACGGRDFHVLHLAGRRDYEELRERLAAAPHAERYTLLEYEPDLGDGLAACDLVLARSGGSIFEVAAAGRPAILVPYPYATADHQSANAAWMARGRRGACDRGRGAERRAARGARSARCSATRARLARDVGRPRPPWPGPMPRARDRRRGPGGGRGGRVDSAAEHGPRAELHFIGIGGAGMSGLALVCARLGATVTGSDRADSSYMERLRAAGLEPRVGHDAANLPGGRRGRRLDRDRRRQPGAGAGPRARPARRSTAASCSPSSAPRSG